MRASFYATLLRMRAGSGNSASTEESHRFRTTSKKACLATALRPSTSCHLIWALANPRADVLLLSRISLMANLRAMTLDRYSGLFDDHLDEVAIRLGDLLADAERHQYATTGRHPRVLRMSS